MRPRDHDGPCSNIIAAPAVQGQGGAEGFDAKARAWKLWNENRTLGGVIAALREAYAAGRSDRDAAVARARGETIEQATRIVLDEAAAFSMRNVDSMAAIDMASKIRERIARLAATGTAVPKETP